MRGPRNFRQGGSRSVWQKNSDKVFFFFLVLSLFTEVKWSISKKSIIFQGSRGGPKISRGRSNFFRVGSICLFPIETHITCDFPGGSGPPVPPPLWIRTCLYIWVKLYLPIKYQYKLRNVVPVSPGFYFVSSKKHDCSFKYSDVYFLRRKPVTLFTDKSRQEPTRGILCIFSIKIRLIRPYLWVIYPN